MKNAVTTGLERQMTTVRETDVAAGGRVLHAYDTAGAGLPVFWHHGTPNVGAPPEPLFAAAARHGLRWVSYDRPGYGGSTPLPGRDIAAAAADVAAIADALGIGRFAVFGHSGGGPHALACAALLGDRVRAVVSVSGLAPYTAGEFDWFAGMYPGGAAELRAAHQGRAALEFDPGMFTPEDHAALEGDWAWLAGVAGQAIEQGPAGMIDDDLAATRSWGFSVSAVTAPVLLLHGTADRMVPSSHAKWLARGIPHAELRLSPGDGHVSVLRAAHAAAGWVAGHAGG
jgi:pimeloyl-ACP methyl ester carboxylesterase